MGYLHMASASVSVSLRRRELKKFGISLRGELENFQKLRGLNFKKRATFSGEA